MIAIAAIGGNSPVALIPLALRGGAGGKRELFLGSLFARKAALPHSGIGKVNAASAVTALLEAIKPGRR
ncbi:MAG: hypothetical protein R2864_10810 [Syntrophotaleaceae bacterium]